MRGGVDFNGGRRLVSMEGGKRRGK